MRGLGKIASVSALLAITAGCQKTESVTGSENETHIRVNGIAQYYHIVQANDEVKSYYVGEYDAADTIRIAVPAGDSVTVGAESLRGTEWQTVKVVPDSIYKFRVK